ncbi:MAG: S8 family serine peptidase, partial [Acidobacteriota bacterium]
MLNSTSAASDNAALAGVIVVTSAGNAGDSFFISGAPGAASRAIATAASVDPGVTASVVRINAPGGIAGFYPAGTAQFGGVPPPAGITGNVVAALDPADGAGPLTTDGCSPLTNAAAIAGNIALIDRGTCGFAVKVKNAQNAGAIAVLIANSSAGVFGGMAGVDATITIPSLMVTFADGNTFKANIATLNATLLSGQDTVASFSSRGPRRIYGSPLRLKPDIAAPGLNITSVQTGHTCTASAGCTGLFDPTGFQAGNQTLTISGTSMASPHIAGIMALLRQLKPGWSVEELKALAMNYAIHDMTVNPAASGPRYGPSRIGGGRVDPVTAAVGNVIALNGEDAGVVSVTFNPEVNGVVTQVKKVRLLNKGLTPQTYTMAFDNVVDSPGVSFSLPGGSSVTVPTGQSVAFDVQMSANSALMDHTMDPTLATTQFVQTNYGNQPRNFLTEESSYLTFSQSSTLKFRLPVYMAEKPASNMSAADTIVTGGAPTGSTTIALSGSDICTGTLAAGPTCTGVGTLPKIESMVSPFELQVVSPLDPVNSTDYADIHYVGTTFLPGLGSPSLANDLIMFGMASWGDWSTPNDVAYNVCVDNNNDGVYDKIVYNSNPSIFVANSSPNDNYVRIIRDTVTNGNTILGTGSLANLVSPASFDTAMQVNNTMFLGVTPSQLGYTSTANTTMRYKVVTCPGSNPGCARTTTGDRCSPPAGSYFDQAAGPFVYNWGAQGLNFGGNFLDEDLNGNTLPVTWNTANLAANGSVGALILHHHNGAGKRAEVVLLDTALNTDLAVTAGSAPTNPPLNSTVTVTVNVTNNGPTPATGVVVSAFLPSGLTYVSDSAGGAYNPGTGLWTVGALANAATQTLTIVTTVSSTDPQLMTAQITANSPLDPIPTNNVSSFVVSAPRSSDLAVTMSASSPTALVGTAISYTITVKNNGVDPAYSVNLTDSFPSFPGLSLSTATPSQGVFDIPTKTWNLAGLGSGFSANVVVGLSAPNMAGPLQNSASATSVTADPNAINNSASATINVLSPSNVTGLKTNNGNKYIGGTVTYTVVLTNNGSFPQQDNPGNEFTDVLPSTMTLVSANATSGTALATIGTNTVSWNGSIPPSVTVTITVTATVNGTAVPGATITNNGTISYDADGNGTNESTNPASSSFVVVSPATVAATKTASGQFRAGGAISYTVVLSNSGPAAQLD